MVLLSLTNESTKPEDSASGLMSSANFEIDYNFPLEFFTTTEIALIGCNMSYSWQNISSKQYK
jgi:hypothetical protein